MKNTRTPILSVKFIFSVLFLLFISFNIIAQPCTGGSSCNWSGGPYRYNNGGSNGTPISLGCTTTASGNNWTSYGPSWGGQGTPLLQFTAAAGQNYTFTLSGGGTYSGVDFLINIHDGWTAGSGACIKYATSVIPATCTLNVLSTDLVAGNNYTVQFAECGSTAGSCVSVYRISDGASNEFINIGYGQTGATAPAQPSTINPSAAVCVGVTQTYCVTNVGGVTYTWSVTAGGTITAGQGTNCVDINWTTTGIKTITCSPSAGGCTGTSRTRNITVNDVPAAVTVSTPGTYCGSTTLTATGGTTRYWQNTTSGGTSTATPSSSQVVSASGTYYFRANNTCGWGTEGSATVVINPYPVVNAIGGGAASVMVGNSTPAFTNSTPGGTWSITNGTGSATINGSGVATGTSVGTVTVNYSVTANGCTTTVTTTLNVTMFMPVELLNFYVKCEGAKAVLQWMTATETNNDYFLIERAEGNNSVMGEWNISGTIKGAGNSSTPRSYEFADEQISNFKTDISNLYYRLKQTDFDGKYKYYGPVSLELCSSQDLTLITQTVFADELSATLIAKENTNAVVQVVDLQGRFIHTEKINAIKGANPLQLNLRNVEAGTYFIKIYNEKNFVTRRIVKVG